LKTSCPLEEEVGQFHLLGLLQEVGLGPPEEKDLILIHLLHVLDPDQAVVLVLGLVLVPRGLVLVPVPFRDVDHPYEETENDHPLEIKRNFPLNPMKRIDLLEQILKMIPNQIIIKLIKNLIQKLIKIIIINLKLNQMKKIQTKNRILNHILEPNLLATEHAKDQIQEKKENLDLDRQKPIRFMLII